MEPKPLSKVLTDHSEILNRGGQPPTISSEQEIEYILTPEDEARILRNEIERLKDYYRYQVKNRMDLSPVTVEEAVAAKDFESGIDKAELFKRMNFCAVIKRDDEQRNTERLEAKKREREDLEKFWTASTMYRFLADRCRQLRQDRNGAPQELIYDDSTSQLIKTYCYFLSRDSRLESELGLSLKKGLVVLGKSGLGKTFLAECLSTNGLNPICQLSMIEITDDIRHEGEYDIYKKAEGSSIIYLDDVGTEETPVNYYGTKINWFKEFAELYYSRSLPFNRLMLSTNLGADEIEEKYGSRVRSRFRDMFNIVKVDGKDMRGL